MRKTIIVTGGAGFIGSAVIRQLIENTPHTVVNLDKLTYAGNLATLNTVADNKQYCFEQIDICDALGVQNIFDRYHPQAVIHLAAESHVDRSIDGPADFIQTNIVGTHTLLDCAQKYWRNLDSQAREDFRFHHVSTDEVFGSLGAEGLFTEETAYQPNSPYSASKASSDHLVRAWRETYGLPTMVSNCSNNYGPYQYPEKLIPVIISKALVEQDIPVYGKGDNVRDWLYVEDHARALCTIMEKGAVGETYNVGGNSEKTNLEVVKEVCDVLDDVAPRGDGVSYESQITFVKDRPGHDFRYAIDASKIYRELNWQPKESFSSGIRKTVQWYLSNQQWSQTVTQGDVQAGRRIGREVKLGAA